MKTLIQQNSTNEKISGTNLVLGYTLVTIIQKVKILSLTNPEFLFNGRISGMKGVNKLVVEIRPECEYFEKALLFIRPEKRDVPQKTISDNADKLLSDISIVKNNKESNKKYPVLLVIAGIITGSAVTSLIAFLSGLL